MIIKTLYAVGGCSLYVKQRSPLTSSGHALVLPANPELKYDSGWPLHRTIVKQIGMGLFDEARAVAQEHAHKNGWYILGRHRYPVQPFSAHVTSGNALLVQYVIHAVLIDLYLDGLSVKSRCNVETLSRTLKNVLDTVNDYPFETVAFPLIGTTNGLTPEESIYHILTACKDAKQRGSRLRRVELYVEQDSDYSLASTFARENWHETMSDSL
mgnify:CR=1 FL=1